MRQIPRKRRGQRHQFFDADGVDEVLSCVLRLTAEISAVKDRLYLAERVLEAQGLDMSAAIEAYTPSATESEEMADARERLIQTVLAQLGSAPMVETIPDENPPVRTPKAPD